MFEQYSAAAVATSTAVEGAATTGGAADDFLPMVSDAVKEMKDREQQVE